MYPLPTDDEATVIDREPHWSTHRRVLAASTGSGAVALPGRVPMIALPRPVQKSSVPLIPPAAAVRIPFYSFAEEQASLALDTECVAPLPLSSLRPDWQLWVAARWPRLAILLGGAFVGTLLAIAVVGGGARGRALASAAQPVVMSVEAPAMIAAPSVAPAIAEAPIADAAIELEPVAAAAPAKRAAPKRTPAKRVASKRTPIKLNASTALGDLRPSR